MTPQEFTAFVANQVKEWYQPVKDSGAKLNGAPNLHPRGRRLARGGRRGHAGRDPARRKRIAGGISAKGLLEVNERVAPGRYEAVFTSATGRPARSAARRAVSRSGALRIRHRRPGAALPPAVQVHPVGLFVLPRRRVNVSVVGSLSPRLADPHRPLGAHRGRHRVDRRVVLFHLARQPPRSVRASATPNLAGELYAIHGGGFYRAQKYRLAPAELPKTLHWFKWEAYWTWITGFALLVLIYYLNPELYLIDPAVMQLSPARRSASGSPAWSLALPSTRAFAALRWQERNRACRGASLVSQRDWLGP